MARKVVKSKSVYVVIGKHGELLDEVEWALVAFMTLGEAEECVKRCQAETNDIAHRWSQIADDMTRPIMQRHDELKKLSLQGHPYDDFHAGDWNYACMPGTSYYVVDVPLG